MGAAVGALTMGSAFPHLVRAIGVGFDWRFVIAATSLTCLVAAAVSTTLKDGPHQFKSARCELGHLKRIVRNRAAMLANKLGCIHYKTVRGEPRPLKSLACRRIPPRNQRHIPGNISKSESDSKNHSLSLHRI